jgi:hypothetical protein
VSDPIPAIALIVIAHILDERYPTFSDEEAAQTDQLWHELQRDLVNLVPEDKLLKPSQPPLGTARGGH